VGVYLTPMVKGRPVLAQRVQKAARIAVFLTDYEPCRVSPFTAFPLIFTITSCFACFTHFSYSHLVHLRQQSSTRKLFMQRSDIVSLLFVIVQCATHQMSLRT